ncbi:DinB family protein [Streptomyces sp. NPDC058463]|uniref:DinB family protein n=1 Tax=Streptomyces sp. NPDC058463 TaxID=3346510 RepID=UPI00365B3DD0
MTSPGPVTCDLLETFDDVQSRTLARLDGLTDAEYLWEPVASCLTLRTAADGVSRADPRPAPDVQPAPFATIGWRIWHIGADCLRAYGRYFEDEFEAGDRHVWPGSATEGIRMLADDWSRFRARVESLGDEGLLQPMGPRAGAYDHESYLLLALHALDEAAHHAAELGVLRDLYLHAGVAEQTAKSEGLSGGQPPGLWRA